MPLEDEARGFINGPRHPDGGTLPLSNENDEKTLRWLRAALEEGIRIVKDDPAHAQMDKAMQYVLGEQYVGKDKPAYLSSVVVNRTKKSIRSHVSALTDLKPLFAYKTYNQRFKHQADLLNQIVVLWWMNNFVDIDFADGLRYALTAGTSYLVCDYDPHLGPHGDNRIIPKDPRDVIPIRPSRDRSIQNWEGVIIRESHSINVLRGMYPDKAHLITADRHSKQAYGPVRTAFKRMTGLLTPVTTLDGLGKPGKGKGREDEIVVYRATFHDRRTNHTSEPIVMGPPDANWSYIVQPNEPMYPRGRLVVATEHVVLFDGPNPYWHGRFNLIKLTPDPWPWTFLGLSLVHDLMPMNEALNSLANSFLMNFTQHANPGAIFDKNAVPDNVFKRLDTRKPGWKLKINPTYGEGAKVVDPPQLPPWSMDFMNALSMEFDNLSGTANLQALLNLRQSPSAETIQKYWEALTPEIRLEGRILEAAIRELAEMIKVNIFQFYSAPRRILMLGDAGMAIDDLDFDPGTLVPSMMKGEKGYAPELDKSRPRDARAQWFQRLFSFYVQPHSLLAMHAQDRKMLHLQLARMGYMDFWTLMEMLEVPNIGDPPPTPLPALEEPFQEPGVNPETGMPQMVPRMEVRQPNTITEKLIAQNQLGIGMTENPAGRKASGQSVPSMQSKTDAMGAQRTTISESE